MANLGFLFPVESVVLVSVISSILDLACQSAFRNDKYPSVIADLRLLQMRLSYIDDRTLGDLGFPGSVSIINYRVLLLSYLSSEWDLVLDLKG